MKYPSKSVVHKVIVIETYVIGFEKMGNLEQTIIFELLIHVT